MSSYDSGSKDINSLLEILSNQAVRVNEYNTDANSALDKELRDILIGYRDDEIKVLCQTLHNLKKRMPEFNTKLNSDSRNYNDIGIGDLK